MPLSFFSALSQQLTDCIQHGINIIYPPRCLRCHIIISQIGALCPDCWQSITFNTPPHCALCSQPFPYDAGENALCATCIATPPAYARIHTVFHYNDNSKALIHTLKYSDGTYTIPTFAAWMQRAGDASLRQADLITAVPLHKRRLLTRYFNQAALLAKEIGRLCQLPVYPELMLRTRHTPPQAGLSSRERIRNVRGVFKLHPRYATLVKDKHIIVVDDVMTTGATISACTQILRKAGATKVTILTLAKTMKQ